MILDFSRNGMNIIFETDNDDRIALKEFSYGKKDTIENKNLKWCPITDVFLTGEDIDDHHGAKHTRGYGAINFKYKTHKFENNELKIYLVSEKINATVYYQFFDDIKAVKCYTVIENVSDEKIGVDYVSSFAYTGLKDKDAFVYIPQNSWLREVNWKKYSLSDLGLDRYNAFSMKRITVSNTGTWSTKESLPLAIYEADDSFLMWQIENNGSWQWEISDISNMLYLRVSGPDNEVNHWHKELKPNESFESVKACIAFSDSFDGVVKEMTAYRREIFKNNEQNKKMPVIFNDYMNCLFADPTEEKIIKIADKAAAAGAEYYCIDAGWYADGEWWDTVGQWQPCQWRFPNGIKKVIDYIKSKNMIPGLWLEIEVMGVSCPILDQFDDDCFFMRYGKRVVDHGRYQLDFRNKKVIDFANSVIDRLVLEYGIGYIKMDYNIEAGCGTEVNADSFGDGLLEHNRAYLKWIDDVEKRYPDLIIENCSSGGMRMEYAMLSKHHIQSTSDQENYKYTAFVASSAPTVVLPEQAAVWAYPKSDEDKDAVAFNMVNAILQRIHLSGELANLSEDKFNLVKEAIACYKEIRNDILNSVPIYPIGVPMYNDEWLCLALKCDKVTRVAVWRMNSSEDTLKIPFDMNKKQARLLYPSYLDTAIKNEDDGVLVKLSNQYSAVLFEIR